MKLDLRHALLTLALTSLPSVALAYDEAVSGDLSSNPATPTPLTFVSGSNQVKGTVRNTSPSDLRDYFTFVVPPGQELSAIRLVYGNVVGGGSGNVGFQAINRGATSELPDPSGNNEDFFLGGDHAVSVPPTENILLDLADGNPAGTGFTTPLGPGTYTYLMQQVSGATTYDLQFILTSAPAPTAAPASGPWLTALLAALLILAACATTRLRSAWRS